MKALLQLLIASTLSLGVLGCAHQHAVVPNRGYDVYDQPETVLASFYGESDGLHGKKTASGEKYDSNALTAAHKHLPFGTMLKVTNPKTQKSVRVKVNDRGPYTNGRELDLSARAARDLGIAESGVASVIVEQID